ncbi:hypothetical protein TSACC_21308 [Terrimicrobium sacchariphilum]|uniref:Band 7 domain-containing protein n=1 Tax=Terrimicrobium sacchariphilum TaxID=690879 RepID=A0A146G8D5_TERSA|nr:flotillin family protein [Terrimicrobium sacchariphilum]GAT32906.1 hypothetical protein TSACC_21308 [Terrimicrobium sacchariphilum]
MNEFSNIIFILVVAGIVLVALFTIGLIVARLYHRASKETSFVRTGFGGQRVIMSGGAIVVPVLHETIPVNMNTLRLEVRRANEQALITKDRMRVDVQAEFYVRVKPTAEAVADAAQTLGRRTTNPQLLKELVEGKFVDALRAVAAAMNMEELHEQRVDFVQRVQQAVSEDLRKNGLELESVSLTSLDQTSQQFFNPQNAFDAQGLTKLTQEIEARRKQRNDIEQETAVQIQMKNLEAERQSLEITREAEYARLEQAREVEIRRAAQSAEIAAERAAKEREAKEAEITAKQAVDQAQILAERAISEERIRTEQTLKQRDIEKIKAVETAEVEKTKAVELSEQDRAIAVAAKSKQQSEAETIASHARALSVKAAEEVITVKEREIAERQKQIELVEAAKQAEREAIGVTVAAEAEKQAAQDRAEAARIAAQGEAEAEKLRAEAAEKRYSVDAAGTRALHEAENVLSAEVIAMKIQQAILANLPQIIRESVKPMERIDGIKIVQVGGLNGEGAPANGATVSADGGNLADQVVSSALRYRTQAPLVDTLLKEVGIDGASVNGLTQAVKSAFRPVEHGNGEAPQQTGNN